jgi:hypothetical protein
MGNRISEEFMKFKLRKSTKPAKVPLLGLTVFIALIGVQGFIGAFDSVMNETISDRLVSSVAGVGFTTWAILRALEMKKFQYKLRKRPRLSITISIGMVGLFSFADLFSSTVTISNSQSGADRLLGFFVGICFTLWAVLRYIFGREFEKSDK